jgi:hypothetical protein
MSDNATAMVLAGQMSTPGDATGGISQVTTAGKQMVTNLDGTRGKDTVLLSTMDPSRIQRILQFPIDNTGAGSKAVKVRFGSYVGQKDAYANFGITEGACDNAVVTDDIGVGCKRVQAFSKFVEDNPVVTGKIKILCDDVNQLAKPVYHKSLNIDGSEPNSTTIDVAYTQSRSDNRQNLVEIPVSKVLDSTRYFEYLVGSGTKLTFYIELAGISNTETFTPLPGVIL